MNQTQNIKKLAMIVILLTFISGVSAVEINNFYEQPIKDDNPYQGLIETANSYEVVNYFANKYEKVAIEFTDEDYRLVIEFEDSKIIDIRESEELVDFEIRTSKKELKYLLDNWRYMGIFDRINFLLGKEIPLSDILSYGSYMVSMR